MMRFSMLVKRLYAKHGGLTHGDCDLAVRTILRGIGEHLSSGGRVEIRDFGAFTVRTRGARLGRNPKTGAPVDVPAKARPHFKVGRALKEGVKSRGKEKTTAPVSDGNKWAGLVDPFDELGV